MEQRVSGARGYPDQEERLTCATNSQTDSKMAVLFKRLEAAGVDYSDLIP